jgi:hypothetical protein
LAEMRTVRYRYYTAKVTSLSNEFGVSEHILGLGLGVPPGLLYKTFWNWVGAYGQMAITDIRRPLRLASLR